jgi:preprotein translocase subunit SecF
MRLFGNAHYDFIHKRQVAYVGSIAALVLGIVFAIFWQVKRGSWLNYGVDFTGGTLVQVRFNVPTDEARLRELVQPVIPGTDISRFGASNEFLFRAPQFNTGGTGTGVSNVLVDVLRKHFANNFTVVRTEAVGPKVGNELQSRAALAVLVSFLATLMYIAFRFEWRFGIAALIATFHDTLLTVLFISAFQLDVSLPTVAAVLTIVGYSLNDTVIIFDRIRENLKSSRRKELYESILNRSINETLPRTVLTVSTTLATLYTLFFLGGETLREFAEIMIIGVMVGTYSSIFVASPILYEINKRWAEKAPERKTAPARAAGANV